MHSRSADVREIRVFLSSTFRDMDAERTYLVKQVFPKVRAACLERQVGFSEIDLRWGVSEEEAKNGATVEICLKEIDRCRDFPPFFIGFLGERYGWVPRHDELQSYWGTRTDTKYEEQILGAVKQGISVTELEMELAVLSRGAAKKIANHALFCLRDAKLTEQLYQLQTGNAPNHTDSAFYDAGQGKLDVLKDKIRRSEFLGLDNYTTVEQFGAAVESYLLGQLDRYFPADEVPTPLQRTNTAHQAFRFHRLQNFLSRTDVREQMTAAIEQRIEAPFLGPILVTGPSGQGKSALMADLARHLQAAGQKTHNPNKLGESWRVIDHYVGADSANHLDGWVDRILNTLHPDIKDIAGDIPESPKDKVEVLSTWISMAARRLDCRYLFILDALDQLSDGGKNLDILTPQTLGPDGILIASAADETPARDSANKWQTLLEVPPLTNELKIALIQDTLDRYRKKLPPELASKLAEAPQSGSPLFLILALEELRVDARHETLVPTTAAILKQPDAEHLFLNHFLLDADNGRPELPELAASFMALLGASRDGVSEIELEDLLALPVDPIADDTGKPRMPQVHLSKLLNNLAPFLLNKQGRRAPMHRIFGEVALNYYGTAPVRQHLYAHFESGYGKGKNEYEARGAAEALHQITELAKLEQSKQKQMKRQLVADVGYFTIPVKLHNDQVNNGGKLILDALDSLAPNEKNKVKTLWTAEIERFNNVNSAQEYLPILTLGEWLNYMARYPLALAVIDSLHKSIGSKHGSISASVMEALGDIYFALAKADDAEMLLQRAVKIREKLDDQVSLSHCLCRLAMVLSWLKSQYDQAEPIYRRSLSLVQGDPSSYVVQFRTLNYLAALLKARGDYSESEAMFIQALEVGERIFGKNHPEIAKCENNLAWLHKDRGEWDSAERLFNKVFYLRERVFGPDHPLVAESLNGLGLLMRDRGCLDVAEKHISRALMIRKNSFGGLHPDVATSINGLASIYLKRGEVSRSRPMFLAVLKMRQDIFGTIHPHVAGSFSNIADQLLAEGNLADAKKVLLKAKSQWEKIFHKKHQEVASVLYRLGLLSLENRQFERAKKQLTIAVKIWEFVFGIQHPDTIKANSSLLQAIQLNRY